MSREKLVGEVQKAGLERRTDAERAVDTVFTALDRLSRAGEPVLIRGFGKFEVKDRQARKGRNPRTGEPVTIAPRRVLTFKDARQL